VDLLAETAVRHSDVERRKFLGFGRANEAQAKYLILCQ
jgi:hypothetical protein